MVYLKEKNGRWLAKAAGSEFTTHAPEDFGRLHDPDGKTPVGQWLTMAEIRNATRSS